MIHHKICYFKIKFREINNHRNHKMNKTNSTLPSIISRSPSLYAFISISPASRTRIAVHVTIKKAREERQQTSTNIQGHRLYFSCQQTDYICRYLDHNTKVESHDRNNQPRDQTFNNFVLIVTTYSVNIIAKKVSTKLYSQNDQTFSPCCVG